MSLPKTSDRQLERTKRLYPSESNYDRMLSSYLFWTKLNYAQKHSTHDSVFFIVRETKGFKTVKFYNDGFDYRVSGYVETLAEAYNEGFHTL